VLRFAPPLTISREELDEAVDILCAALADLRAGVPPRAA